MTIRKLTTLFIGCFFGLGSAFSCGIVGSGSSFLLLRFFGAVLVSFVASMRVCVCSLFDNEF